MAKDASTPSRGASLITIQSSIFNDLKTHQVLIPNTKVIMFAICSNEAEKSRKETQTHLSSGPHQLLWQEAALSGPSEAASSLQSQEESSLSFNLSAEPCTQQTAKADCILFSLKHTNTHSRVNNRNSPTTSSSWPTYVCLPLTETGDKLSAVFACF